MNPSLMKAKEKIREKTEIPKEIINSQNFNPATYTASIKQRNKNKENGQEKESIDNSHDVSKDSYAFKKTFTIRRHYEEEEKR